MNKTDQILRDKLGSYKSPLPAGDWQDMRAIYVSAYYKKAQRLSAIFIVASLAVLALCFGLTSPKHENSGTAKLSSIAENLQKNESRQVEPVKTTGPAGEKSDAHQQKQSRHNPLSITKPAKKQTAAVPTEDATARTEVAAVAELNNISAMKLQALGWKSSEIQAPELVKDLPHTLTYPNKKFRFTPFVSYSYGLGGLKVKNTGNANTPLAFEKGNFFVETLSAELGMTAGKEKSVFSGQIGLAITDQKVKGNYYLPMNYAIAESQPVERNSPQLFSSYILSLPLSVSYRSPVKFCGITTFIHAGAEPGYAFSQKGTVPNANTGMAPATPQDFNAFSFGWKAGVGIGYSLNRKLNAKLLYHYNQQLTSFYSGSGAALKPYRHTVSLLFELGR